MIDFRAACVAFAERFDAGTIATPTGAKAMRPSFSEMPESAPALPCVYVEPTTGTVVANATWDHEMDVDAVFLISQRSGTTKRPEKERQLWLPSLLAATQAQMKLGIGAQIGWELKKAIPTGWTWDEVDVADISHHAIRVHYRLFIAETVNLAAA